MGGVPAGMGPWQTQHTKHITVCCGQGCATRKVWIGSKAGLPWCRCLGRARGGMCKRRPGGRDAGRGDPDLEKEKGSPAVWSDHYSHGQVEHLLHIVTRHGVEKSKPQKTTHSRCPSQVHTGQSHSVREREVWVDRSDRQCHGRSGGNTIQRINQRKERAGSTRMSQTKMTRNQVRCT